MSQPLRKPAAVKIGRLARPEQPLDLVLRRYGAVRKGDPLPKTQVPACPRVRVNDFPAGIIPEKFKNYLEHNQKIASCCRHPENHDIEALKSHPEEPAPDIYIFHCTCGRKHRIFCVGATDEHRPIWE